VSKIGCREIHFVKATNPSQIDFLIVKIKEALRKMEIPTDYEVRIYRNVLACCGIGGFSLIVEVAGSDEEKIKAIDLRATSRIIEFCEKEGIEVGNHSSGKFELI
jgi:predicted HicB family RNase H-like nuclease